MKRRLLRPWPLLPLASWLIIFPFVEIQNLYYGVLAPEYADCRISCLTVPKAFIPLISSDATGFNQTPHDVVGNLINAAATATALALVLLIARRFQRDGQTLKGWQYVLSLVLASLAAAATRLAVLPLKVEGVVLESVPAISIRYLILISTAHLLLGINTERYRRAMFAAHDAAAEARHALAQVKEQQSLVVEADEKVRREIANFLHDRVQAGLLVAAMQVRQALDSAPAETKNILEPAISDLEKLRVDDVRAAGRRLSPDLNAVGLDSALRDLARSWSAAMKVKIDCQATALEVLHRAPDVTIATALYRTVEQALLNSAAHGQAESVDVEIASSGESLLLMVCDNGRGLASPHQAGSGSALIDAWMGAVNGQWHLEPRDVGCVLKAIIPLN